MFDLLRTDEVNMSVETPRRGNQAFARDRLGAGPNHDIDIGLDIAIAGFPDPYDATASNTDIRLHHTPMIQNQGIGDDCIDTIRRRLLALTHPVPDDLASPELDLFAEDGPILFNFNKKFSIRESHAIADGGSIHLDIGLSADLGHALPPSRSERGPINFPLNPYTTRSPASSINSTVRA